MARKKFCIVAAIMLAYLYPAAVYCQVKDFGRVKWQRERIAPGLVWKSTHSIFFDSLLQNINILEMNPRKRELAIVYDEKRNRRLSAQVEGTEAIAAVNGGFFNVKEGGSVTYIRTGGVILEKDTAASWNRNSNMTGTLMIDSQGKVFIDSARSNGWYDSHPGYPDVLLTGPLLLKGKGRISLPSTSLVTVRHPRTAIGLVNKRKVILVTLDGRTRQARGLSLYELGDLMISLGCVDAVNLDGGGSTTMWISGKPFNGIVNMPCDNKKFDHEGERAVSNILIVR